MKTALLIASLAAILIIAAIGMTRLMADLGEVAIGTQGTIALVLGVVLTFAVGAGLMALVFFSHRRGYDERAHRDDDRG